MSQAIVEQISISHHQVGGGNFLLFSDEKNLKFQIDIGC